MKERIIDHSSQLPTYVQIAQWVKKEIIKGNFKVEDKLPPVRDLAKLLKVNPNTIVKAYHLLVTDEMVESKPGSGYRVIYQKQKLDPFRTSLLKSEFQNFITHAMELGASKNEIRELMKEFLNND